jgi:DNA-binding NtrC family response regulator
MIRNSRSERWLRPAKISSDEIPILNRRKPMNAHLVLLLTADHDFEKLLIEALPKPNETVLATRDVGDALEIVCARAAELDLVVIDRDDCHGMTLLNAISMCRHDLPIVVVTSTETYHTAALAYANGAAACLAKPITSAELALALQELRKPKLELAAV